MALRVTQHSYNGGRAAISAHRHALRARPAALKPSNCRCAGLTSSITDCCATTSAEGHKGATEGTFGMFSSPMTGEEFLKKINA